MNTYVRRDFYLSAFAGIAIGLAQIGLLVLGVVFILSLVGCQPVENTARDSIAVFQGYLLKAQETHTSECIKANGNLSVCKLLSQASYAENAAVTALEAYCGFGPHSDLKAKCKPVTTAHDGLVVALQNLKQLSTEIRGAAQ